MLLKEFLTLILPAEGVKCWVAIQNKVVRQGFTESFEDLATILQGVDTRQWDAYFACASYKSSDNRRQDNALAAKAFWLDIDAGNGKPYEDAEAAILALDEFAEKANLPLPIVVRSGNGIHAYWVLDRVVSAAEWLPVAKNLKALTALYGLHADVTRTADISSILRAPSTFNWKSKDNPKAVVIDGDDYEIVAFETFSNLRATAPKQSLASSIIGNSGQGRPSMTQGYPDGQRTSELMRRVGYCLGPDKMAEEQTLEVIRAWNKYNTPPKNDRELVSAVRSIYAKESAKPADLKRPDISHLRSQLPEPPYPYFWTEDCELKITLDEEGGDDKTPPKTVSEYPIYLETVCRREGELLTSYIFKQYHPLAGWHDFYISAEEFHAPGWLGYMTKYGADIAEPKFFKKYVHGLAVRLKGERMDTTRFDQFGWKYDYSAFLVGETLFYDNGKTEKVYGTEELSPRMKMMELPAGGSLKEWTAAADRLYSLGMEAYSFTLLASFAAPLMKFCVGESEGGAMLSLVSGQSGRGKTRILEAMASVWGSYDAIGTTGKDTENSRFRVISKLCNLPVLEDELTQMDPVLLRNFVKDFTVGRDKTRARRDGSVVVKDSRYQTILISASNNSVYETVKASNDAGAAARIFEINIEIPDSKEFDSLRFQETLNTMAANRGYAGRAFITALLQPGMVAQVKSIIDKARDHYIKILETKSDHRYVVHLMTSMLAAAAVLKQADILHFDINRVMEWGIKQARSRVADTPATNFIEIFGLFVNDHIFDCLSVQGPHKNQWTPVVVLKEPTRGLKMRHERDNHRLYISVAQLKMWCQKKHISYVDLYKYLLGHDILLSDKKMITLSAGTNYPSVRMPCWEIDTQHPELSGSLRELTPSEAAKN